MKVIVVFGPPCAGKTTYVKEQVKENDLVYDYDSLQRALSFGNGSISNKNLHDYIISFRRLICDRLFIEKNIDTAYIITTYLSDNFKSFLKPLNPEYVSINPGIDVCFEQLEADIERPDKEAQRELIQSWYKRYEGGEQRNMKEIRVCEIRAAGPAEPDGLIIQGVPIVYDTPTTINDPAGAYTEIIRKGALDDTDVSDTRLLYNHDLNKVPLARTPKTMQLVKGPAGLEMVASLPDTAEAQAVYTAVKRGDLSGMSFAFKVPVGGDRWNRETRVREIFKIDKIYEVSIAPFPAYPQASVEARSALQDMEKRAALIIKCNQLLLKS